MVDVGGAATVVVVTGGGWVVVVVGEPEGGSTVTTADDGPTSAESGEGSAAAAAAAATAAAVGGAADPEGRGTAAAWDFEGGRVVERFLPCDTDELGLAVSGNEARSISRRAIVSGCSEARDGMTCGAKASW